MWFLLPAAIAATVTELPPFLLGDGGLAYSYDRLSGSLDERGAENWDVGQRSLSTHRIDYQVAFGFAPGAALRLQLPHYVRSSVSYGAAQEMVYDPATGTGTFYGTDSLEPGAYVIGQGVGGLWIDVAGQPFSEAWVKRNNKSTWLVSLGVRTPDGSNIWTVNEAGKRGAGPGGSAVRLGSAFSKSLGNAEPYIVGEVVFENATSVEIRDNDGALLSAGEVKINPADHGSIKAGAEVTASRNGASGAMVGLDIHMGAEYAAYGDVASGVYLPDALDASLGTATLQSESFDLGGGVGLIWRPMEYLQVHGWGELFYHMPQRIESPYPVYTWTDTTRSRVGVDITVRVRRARAVLPQPAPAVEENPWGS